MTIKLRTTIAAALLAGLSLVGVNAIAAPKSSNVIYVHNHHHRAWIPDHYVTHKIWTLLISYVMEFGLEDITFTNECG
jgi:hypothetical protein